MWLASLQLYAKLSWKFVLFVIDGPHGTTHSLQIRQGSESCKSTTMSIAMNMSMKHFQFTITCNMNFMKLLMHI